MCCQRSGAKAELSRIIRLAEGPMDDEKFWHSRAPKTDATDGEVLNRLRLKLRTSDAYSELTPEQRNDINETLNALRTGEPLTEGTRRTLVRYTKPSRTGAVAAGAAAGLMGLVTLFGGGATASAAPRADSVAAQTQTVFTAAKRCTDEGTIVKVAKTMRDVPWRWANGDLSEKRIVKKGKKVCRFNNDGAVYDRNGVLIGLPKSFPKKSTPEAVKALGISKDTPVAPNLTLPDPDMAKCYAPAPADYIKPIAAGWSTAPAEDGFYRSWTTYEISGGEGVIELNNTYTDGEAFVELRPGVTQTFTTGGKSFSGAPETRTKKTPTPLVGTDCGQQYVPDSMTLGWAIDSSSHTAKNANGLFGGNDPRNGHFWVWGDGTIELQDGTRIPPRG